MKRVSMIAPFAALRGNVSGKQDLKYPLNNNKAFEGVPGKRNYAQNYAPRFIITRRGDGTTYFAVRQSTCTKLTTKSQKAMALLGAAGAIYSSMLRRKDLPPYLGMVQLYNYNVEQIGYTGTFRAFVMDFLRAGLIAKVQRFSANVASISVEFKNPFYDGTMTDGATVKRDILVKFWTQLAPGGINFAVDSAKGIAQNGNTFAQLIASGYNTLGLSTEEVGGTPYVKIGDLWVLNGDKHVQPIDEVVANFEYVTTDEQPL